MRVLENIVKYRYLGVDIRVWFNRGMMNEKQHLDSLRLLCDINQESLKEAAQDSSLMSFADFIAERLPEVNALEVSRGPVGVLIYPDWP